MMTTRRDVLTTVAGSIAAAALLAGTAAPGTAHAQSVQGVSQNEIVIGSIQDLSGPIAMLGKPVQNGQILAVEQWNANGGINGRKLRLIIEDSGYDPKKAVLAAQKLLTQDKVFALIGTLGTVATLPTQQIALDRGISSLFPITAHHGTFEPLHKYKFALATPYPTSTRLGLKEMLRRKPAKRIGILYQDDEYGLEVLRGTEAALKDMPGVQLVEKTSYKRGATDFSSQMQKLKAADVDLVVLGTIVRETIGAMAAIRQLGYTGDFFGSQATYMPVVAKAGGKAVEGLYAVGETPNLYRDDPNNNKLLNEWFDAYKARFNEDPDLYSIVSRPTVDIMAKAAQKAGPKLTSDTLSQALEANGYPRGFLGNPDMKWSATNHLGNNQVKVSQIQNGRWVVVSDFLKD